MIIAIKDFKKRFARIGKTFRNNTNIADGELTSKNPAHNTEDPNFEPTPNHLMAPGKTLNPFSTRAASGNIFASTNDLLDERQNRTAVKYKTEKLTLASQSERAKQRWSKLYNVLKTISLLQRHKTKIINDPEDIVTEINNFPTKPNTVRSKSGRTFHTDFEDKLRSEKFFKYISV
jgi:hypothetical protein